MSSYNLPLTRRQARLRTPPVSRPVRARDDRTTLLFAGRMGVADLRATRLPEAWYRRDACVVARALVGCLVVHECAPHAPKIARIVETEAYRGPLDLACHARAGLTRRTRTLFGPPGHAYVFLVYGMHDCFNVTCREEGAGHAVLVRAAEAIVGIDEETSLRGPGCFARAMGITRETDGRLLTQPPLYLCPRVGRPRIGVSARVGVGYARSWADAPLRFFDLTSTEVSRPPKAAIGRRR